MSFGASALLGTLRELESVADPPARYVVALSGGLDSTVLLHALARTADRHGRPLVAVHVAHGLHAETDAWAEHSRAFAEALGVECSVCEVSVDLASGRGVEAAAREARYAALRVRMEPGDWLLSAHHQDDQAETVLLNLMRSSGATGIAGIRRCRPFASGWLVRPLIDVSRGELEAYAARHSLDYVVDPSNLDRELDRNYLRHEVLPRLEARWPDAARRIRQSAELAREAEELLRDLAAADRERLGDRPDRIELAGFRRLSPARQRNVLRHATGDLGLPLPGRRQLRRILAEVVDAREDAQPVVSWSGASVRRYRDRLYLLTDNGVAPGLPPATAVTGSGIPLPAGLGRLELVPGADRGLAPAVVDAGLELRFRVGGEKIRTEKQRVTKTLKKLLQEAGIVPWMRERLPLLFSGGRLVAVADLWLAADATSSPGTAIRWVGRPAID